MMQRREFKARLINACKMVIDNEEDLTFIDSKFGDADHGETMSQIAFAIKNAVRYANSESIRGIIESAASAVLVINGGSSVPLWYAWLCGLAEKAPNAPVLENDELKEMFANALASISVLTKAQVGDKTMMDALIPATEAILSCEGSSDDMFKDAADAAEIGAKNTENFAAKYGRAKNFGEETIGTADAGALSAMCFFVGLSDKF